MIYIFIFIVKNIFAKILIFFLIYKLLLNLNYFIYLFIYHLKNFNININTLFHEIF
jgi:hypothetical protein